MGWAAFQIPDLGDSGWLATFTATYGSNFQVNITDINPASFGSQASLYTDILGTAYGQVPATSYSDNHTKTTTLGGNIIADILAREGGVFYLGFVGPGPNAMQLQESLRNMSLSLTAQSAVPLPPAAILFSSAMLGMLGVAARRRVSTCRHADAPGTEAINVRR